VIFDAPNTKRNRIAASIAIVLGLCVGFYISLSDRDDNDGKTVEHANTNVSTTSKSLTLEDIDFTSYSEDLAKSIGLEAGEDRWASIDKMRLYFAPEDGTTILNTKTSKFDRPDGSVLIYTVSGLKDDSIKAQELFMIFAGDKDAETLGAFGLKQKCYRGENTNEWTTEHCS